MKVEIEIPDRYIEHFEFIRDHCEDEEHGLGEFLMLCSIAEIERKMKDLERRSEDN